MRLGTGRRDALGAGLFAWFIGCGGLAGAVVLACGSTELGAPGPDSGGVADATGATDAADGAQATDAGNQMRDSAPSQGGSDATLDHEAGGLLDATSDARSADSEADARPTADATDAENTSAVALPGSVGPPVFLGVNRTTGRFYVAWNTGTKQGLSVIDAKTGIVTGTLDIYVAGPLAVDETNDWIYVPTLLVPDGSTTGTWAIVVVDGTNNQVLPGATIYQTQGQAYDAGANEATWGLIDLAVDPAANRLYAYFNDQYGAEGHVFQYDTTSRLLLGSITTPWYGSLVVDPAAHTLWGVEGNPRYGVPGATVVTIDTTTFTVTSVGAMQAANATDVVLDPAADHALVFLPGVPEIEAGPDGSPDPYIVPLPGTVLASDTTGATSTPFTLPAGLAAKYGSVIGPKALLYANDDAGAYYLLGFDRPEAGPWTYHGQSLAMAPEPAPPSYLPNPALNVYGFEVVADANTAYVLAAMAYTEAQTEYSLSSVQYWKVPLP